jgi:large subunit ribosomal protein L7/L12
LDTAIRELRMSGLDLPSDLVSALPGDLATRAVRAYVRARGAPGAPFGGETVLVDFTSGERRVLIRTFTRAEYVDFPLARENAIQLDDRGLVLTDVSGRVHRLDLGTTRERAEIATFLAMPAAELGTASPFVDVLGTIEFPIHNLVRVLEGRARTLSATEKFNMPVDIDRIRRELAFATPAELLQLSKGLREMWGDPASAAEGALHAYRVRMTDCGLRKIEVIKLVREITGLGLKDSKDLVETDNSVVKDNLNQANAELIAQSLTRAGATVRVERL